MFHDHPDAAIATPEGAAAINGGWTAAEGAAGIWYHDLDVEENDKLVPAATPPRGIPWDSEVELENEGNQIGDNEINIEQEGFHHDDLGEVELESEGNQIGDNEINVEQEEPDLYLVDVYEIHDADVHAVDVVDIHDADVHDAEFVEVNEGNVHETNLADVHDGVGFANYESGFAYAGPEGAAVESVESGAAWGDGNLMSGNNTAAWYSDTFAAAGPEGAYVESTQSAAADLDGWGHHDWDDDDLTAAGYEHNASGTGEDGAWTAQIESGAVHVG